MPEKIVSKEINGSQWHLVWVGSETKAHLIFPNVDIITVGSAYNEPTGTSFLPTQVPEIAKQKLLRAKNEEFPPRSILCATDTLVFSQGNWPHIFTSLFKPNRHDTFFPPSLVARLQANKQLNGVLVVTSMAVSLPNFEQITTASSGVIVTIPTNLKEMGIDEKIPGGRQLLVEEILNDLDILFCLLDNGLGTVNVFSCKVDLPDGVDEQNETLIDLLLANERLVKKLERTAKCGLALGFEYIANGRIKNVKFKYLAESLKNKVRAILSGSDRDLFTACAFKLNINGVENKQGLVNLLTNLTGYPPLLFDPNLFDPNID